jgi:hypothetical protein
MIPARREHLDDLGAHRLFCWTPIERKHGRRFLSLPSFAAPKHMLARLPHRMQRDVCEPDEGTPRQVGDQEGHRRGAQGHAELAGDRLDRLYRRRRLGDIKHARHILEWLVVPHVGSLAT